MKPFQPLWSLSILSLILNICISETVDSDSPEYNEMYDKLAVEYIQTLKQTTVKPKINIAAANWQKPVQDEEEKKLECHYNDDFAKIEEKVINEEKIQESYELKMQRLKCDKPWFWRTPQCVWLDYWNSDGSENISQRLKGNTKVAGIFCGVLLGIILLPLCSVIMVACFFASRVKSFMKKADAFMEKLTPGVIVLPDGTKHEYEPTEEEQEALYSLMEEMTTIV